MRTYAVTAGWLLSRQVCHPPSSPLPALSLMSEAVSCSAHHPPLSPVNMIRQPKGTFRHSIMNVVLQKWQLSFLMTNQSSASFKRQPSTISTCSVQGSKWWTVHRDSMASDCVVMLAKTRVMMFRLEKKMMPHKNCTVSCNSYDPLLKMMWCVFWVGGGRHGDRGIFSSSNVLCKQGRRRVGGWNMKPRMKHRDKNCDAISSKNNSPRNSRATKSEDWQVLQWLISCFTSS